MQHILADFAFLPLNTNIPLLKTEVYKCQIDIKNTEMNFRGCNSNVSGKHLRRQIVTFKVWDRLPLLMPQHKILSYLALICRHTRLEHEADKAHSMNGPLT